MRKIIIAIDGLASSGKSTLAKNLAEEFHYKYIDSGAFYRAVTVYLNENQVDWNDKTELVKALHEIHIVFDYNPFLQKEKMLLNGKNIESAIREIQISDLVSYVSAVPEVRKFVVSKLQPYGEDKGIVMDGRDIGTIVFPSAELKVYMTADEKVRTGRRYKEMKKKGAEVSEHQITNNLTGRDLLDSTRMTSPLKKAEDAVVLDNTNMTESEQCKYVLSLANKIISAPIKH
jgi:cytidylate kinase